MAMLGLVGGMSWHSSALYYRRLNAGCENRYGPGATVESVLVTLSFAQLMKAAQNEDWERVTALIVDAALRCERAGAQAVILTAFTGHVAAKAAAEALSVPLLHAGDALADRAIAQGHRRVGLLGTRFMCEAGIIAARLSSVGLEVVMPDPQPTAKLDEFIIRDLTNGLASPAANAALDEAIDDVAKKGASVALLACTELPLLLGGSERALPVIDGVEAHVDAFLDAYGANA